MKIKNNIPHIGIIGAGFTAFACAYYLSKKGYRVTILERSEDVGGLAGAFKIGDAYLEKAYHHLFKTDTDILELINEIDPNLIEWHESSVSNFYKGKFYPFNSAIDLLKFSPLDFFSRLRVGLALFYLQKVKNYSKFEKVSAIEWLKKWTGERACQVLWVPLLKGKFRKYYEKISMAWMWARLHIRANSRSNIFEKEKLGYIRSGFISLINKILEISKNIKVHTKHEVINIEYNQNTNKVIVSCFDSTKSRKEFRFDKVLVTTPSYIFAKLIESNPIHRDYLNKLAQIEYIGAICMIIETDQDLNLAYWNNINDLTVPFGVIVHHTKLIDKKNYNNKEIYYIAGYFEHESAFFSLSDEELTENWFEHLSRIIPSFDKKKIDNTFIFRFKNAQHIVDTNYKQKIPTYETPIPNVYLSNFSQIYPEDRGTNYAVREGKKLAEIILQSIEGDIKHNN